MKIQYSPTALHELDALREFLQDVSPAGLKNVLSAICKTVDSIPTSISRGRSTPHDEVWEKVVPNYGYIIPYLVHDNTVYILHIYNSNREGLNYAQIKQDVSAIQSER